MHSNAVLILWYVSCWTTCSWSWLTSVFQHNPGRKNDLKPSPTPFQVKAKCLRFFYRHERQRHSVKFANPLEKQWLFVGKDESCWDLVLAYRYFCCRKLRHFVGIGLGKRFLAYSDWRIAFVSVSQKILSCWIYAIKARSSHLRFLEVPFSEQRILLFCLSYCSNAFPKQGSDSKLRRQRMHLFSELLVYKFWFCDQNHKASGSGWQMLFCGFLYCRCKYTQAIGMLS